MKIGDLVMRLVCVEEGEWVSALILAVQTRGHDLLIVNDSGQCWVNVGDLATVEEYEELVR